MKKMKKHDRISNEELLDKARKGDCEARDEIIQNNLGLVWSIVRRFQNRGHETEDLFQIGCMGLIKAVNKYDPSYNVKFSTYAVPMIMGEIKRFLRDDGIIKVSRSMKELSNKARILKEEMTMELGREPSVNEMAERLGMEPEDLVMAIESGYTPESLYSDVTDGDRMPTPLIDRIEGGYEDTDYSIVDRIALKQVLETLKPRERQIIVLRYFKEKTQVQVAEMLGISQVQVSRIEKKIINEMRKQINAT